MGQRKQALESRFHYHGLLTSSQGNGTVEDIARVVQLMSMPRLSSPQWFESLPSTNLWMKTEIERGGGIAPGAVIAARAQSAGRGRKDRAWMSGTGNLAFSAYLASSRPVVEIPTLSMAAALAVARWLDTYGLRGEVKWPNDVLVKGRKVSGILAELMGGAGQERRVILGIGVNVNMSGEQCAVIDRPATSLRVETGVAYEVPEALGTLLPLVEETLEQWEMGGFEALREAWMARAYRLHEEIEIVEEGGRRRGVFHGIGEGGELILEEGGRLRRVLLGDVL